MKVFLIGLLSLSSQIFADYKDTGALYQDTTKNINQTISLHNNAAEPAKVVTTTKIRRVPKYKYYNVYKEKVVWKCLPNGGGTGGATPRPVITKWTATGMNIGGGRVFSGNAFSRGWSIRINRDPSSEASFITYTLVGPCGQAVSGGFHTNENTTVCGVGVFHSFAIDVLTIGAGSY